MRDIITSTLQGIGIGNSIMLIFIAAFQMHIGFSDVAGIFVFGAVCGFLPIVYRKENLPFLLQVIIHSGGSLLAFIIVASLNNWFPMKASAIASSLVSFIIIFLIIWSVFFIIDVQRSKKINNELRNQ